MVRLQFGLGRILIVFWAVAFLLWANLPVSPLAEDYEVDPSGEFGAVKEFLFMRGWPVPIWTHSWANILGTHIKEWHFWGIFLFNTLVQVLIIYGVVMLPRWLIGLRRSVR